MKTDKQRKVKQKNRALALLLSVMLILSMMPVTAFGEEAVPPTSETPGTDQEEPEAKTIYVSTSGSDSADGSKGKPYKTILKAINGSANGDCIYIFNGEYVITETMNISSNITISGETTGGVVVKADGYLFSLKKDTSLCVNNLKVDMGENVGRFININNSTDESSNNIEVNNCHIQFPKDKSSRFIASGNGFVSGDFNINNCKIYCGDAAYREDNWATNSRSFSVWNLRNSTVKISNTEIMGFAYCIHTCGDNANSGNNKINVYNSKLNGWAGLLTNTHENNFELKNTTIHGTNTMKNGNNNYSTIVVEKSVGAGSENNYFEFENCEIIANDTVADESEDSVYQHAIEVRSSGQAFVFSSTKIKDEANILDYLLRGDVSYYSIIIDEASTLFGKEGVKLINSNAKIENIHYANVEDAIAAAGENETIDIVDDCEINEETTIDKNITLDLNNRKVKLGEGATLNIGDKNQVIIKDGTIENNGTINIPEGGSLYVKYGASITGTGTIKGKVIHEAPPYVPEPEKPTPPPVVDDSGKVEIETPEADENGKVEAEVPDSVVNDALDKVIADVEAGNKEDVVVEIKVNTDEKTEAIDVKVDSAAIDKIAETKNASLKVESKVGALELDNDVLKEISKNAGGKKVNIAIEKPKVENLPAKQQEKIKEVAKEGMVFDLSITAGDKKISNLGGTATLSVDYNLPKEETPEGLRVYFIDDNGKAKQVNAYYDTKTKKIIMKTDHFSLYVVSYVDVPTKVSILKAKTLSTGHLFVGLVPQMILKDTEFTDQQLRMVSTNL